MFFKWNAWDCYTKANLVNNVKQTTNDVYRLVKHYAQRGVYGMDYTFDSESIAKVVKGKLEKDKFKVEFLTNARLRITWTMDHIED